MVRYLFRCIKAFPDMETKLYTEKEMLFAKNDILEN
jgi:hypothetical protein